MCSGDRDRTEQSEQCWTDSRAEQLDRWQARRNTNIDKNGSQNNTEHREEAKSWMTRLEDQTQKQD